MGKTCCVPGCRSQTKLHRFPNPKTNFERCQAWIAFVGNKKLEGKTQVQLSSFRVCARHFTDEDKSTTLTHRGRNLKCTSVPSIRPTEDEPHQQPQSQIAKSYVAEPDLQEVDDQPQQSQMYNLTVAEPDVIELDEKETMQCIACSLNCDKNSTVNLQYFEEIQTFCFEKIFDNSNINAISPTVCFDCFKKIKEFKTFVKNCQKSYRFVQTQSIKLNHDTITHHTHQDKQVELIVSTEETINDEVEELQKSKLCSYCGTQWPSHSKMLRHMQSHTEKLQYKCKYCLKLLATKSTLDQHEKTHTGEKRFKCEYCNKLFGQSNQLVTHRKQHTGKDIVCEVCGKAFCRKSELNVHMRKHTGEMPYVCLECGKCFRILSHLNEHRSIHADERNFVCRHCGATFKRQSTLLKHELIHSDAFSFKCALCDYGCHKRWGLIQHIEKHHS